MPAADVDLAAPTVAGALVDELKWAFTHPRPWIEGLACNLVLSVLYLFYQPLTGRHRAAWVILVGTYFATFVLADVTTTNILGHDRIRLRRNLARGVGIRTLILRRNVVLLVVVGIPTIVATAILTAWAHDTNRLAYTLPGVAFPIMTWLGVGNVVSVLLPVAWVPMRVRWRLRHHRAWIARWLAHLALPYALYYAVEPVDDWPLHVLRQFRLERSTRSGAHGAILAIGGVGIWLGGAWLAAHIVRRRGLVIR